VKKGTLPSRLRSEVTRTSTESEFVSRPYLTLKSFPRLTIVLEKGGAFFVFSRSDCLAEAHWGKLGCLFGFKLPYNALSVDVAI
jgi:hypothetical protein